MEPEKNKQKKLPLSRLLVLLVAVAVFLYSGSRLLSYFLENYSNKKEQQDLIDQAVVMLPQQTKPTESPESDAKGDTDETEETTAPTEVPVETAPIYVDFAALKAQNEDIVAWIFCPGTKLNYPVVQGDSNQEYLYRTHTGASNSNGSIFLDFRNLPDFSDFNNILYGHHMADGGMFATLRKYYKQEFFDAHPTMWLLTPDKAFRLDLIAAMVTPSDSETYELFSYIEDLHERLEYSISKSTINAGEVDISEVKQIVTMSTCTYEYPTARFVVIGSMVEVAYPEPPETPESTEP